MEHPAAQCFLAEVDDSPTRGAEGECLVIYLPEGTPAAVDLVDPPLIGAGSGRGVWRLLHHEPSLGVAYYARMSAERVAA